MSPTGSIVGGMFLILSMALMVGVTAAWFVFVVAHWKLMKSQEQISETLRHLARSIADIQRPKPPQ